MKIWERIKNKLLYPGARSYLLFQSRFNWLKSLFKKDKVVLEKPYNGKKILLLALYEKGVLRADIENLLATAKKQGVYTLCINTLKLDAPEKYQGLMDCYIERYNFGRDFGSYKTGVNHLYKRNWHEQCPRLLILNDSLFYSKKNLEAFIKNMLSTDMEVLGATENHEIEHHIGSFCLSLDSSIVKHNKFKRYWKEYSNSDLRPTVIKRGEMQLSKALHRCVSSQNNIRALYDTAWLSEYIKNNKGFLDHAYNYYRTPENHWGPPSIKKVGERIIEKHALINPSLINLDANTEVSITEAGAYYVDSPDTLIHAIRSSLTTSESDLVGESVYDEVKNNLLECFSRGSQIHQNGILLHHLGLPIIKLDGLYRGLFVTEDIEKLALQLEPEELVTFKRLMYSNPFGDNILLGWKKAAFSRGLI